MQNRPLKIHKTMKEKDTEPKVSNTSQNTALEIRPKRYSRIQYKLFSDDKTKRGRVKRVWKDTGKFPHRCTIETVDKEEEDIDFTKDVESWNYIQSVQFEEQTEGSKEQSQAGTTGTTVLLAELLNDHKGAKNLIEEVYATTIPASRYKEPEVQQAMKE